MNRVAFILTALLALPMAGCAVESAPDEEAEQVQHEDGARYVTVDEFGNEHQGPNYAHMGFGGPNTNPAGSRSGPFPDPWAPVSGPFPDPWQRTNSGPKNDDKP